MRQRNDTGYEQDLMVWPSPDDPSEPRRKVGVGEEIDFPTLLGGFTVLEDVPAPSEPKTKRKDAAAVADMKEGEQQ